MLRPGSRWLAPALAAVALGVMGCGSDVEKTIPPENADAMLDLLDQIEASAESQDCEIAQNGAVQLRQQVVDLPKEAGAETKETLFTLVDSLEELVESQCEEPVTGASGFQGATDEPATPPPDTSGETTASTQDEAPPEQPNDEGTGLPGNSDNGPPGPSGNPNEGDSGDDDDGGTGSGGIGDE